MYFKVNMKLKIKNKKIQIQIILTMHSLENNPQKSQVAWVQILSLPLIGWVILGKLQNTSMQRKCIHIQWLKCFENHITSLKNMKDSGEMKGKS